MTEPQHAERTSARRILWLVVVPVGAALIPLLVLRASDDSLGGLAALLVGVAPLIGGLGALSFSFVAPVRMAPLVPFVAAGALFLFVLLVAANMTSGDGLDFGPVKVTGVLLPVLALVGGLVSYVWLPEPEPDWEAEHEDASPS